MNTYVTVLLGSALLTIILTPFVSRLAKAAGLVDSPGVRKVHSAPVPRVGGVVFVIAMVVMVVPALFLDNDIGEAFRKIQTQFITLMVAGVLLYLVGLIDDIRSLAAPIKLLSLLGAGVAICLSGARIETLSVGQWFTIDLGWVSWPITLGWITGVTVGMNFIDGLDGLAAGIAAIVCATIGIFALLSGQIAMFVLLLAMVGSLVGFLVFNFNPAKIFMGDGGSMFLGFMIAAGSVVCQAKSATLAGIALPALALGVPILDTALTIIRRAVLDRRSIFAGERGHIHHRLLDKGLQHRTVVMLIYGVTIVAAGIGLTMLSLREGAQIAVFAGGVLFLLIVFALAGSTRVGETLAALKYGVALSRERKEERACFDDAQLHIREARSFETWWDAICRVGTEMEFERLALAWRDGDGRARIVVWRRTAQRPPNRRVVNVTAPLEGGKDNGNARIEMSVLTNGSLEAMGRRITLLGRLLDERSIDLHSYTLGPNQTIRAATLAPEPGDAETKTHPRSRKLRVHRPWSRAS